MPSAFTEFPLATASVNPGELTVGPDGNLWFPENYVPGSNGIGRITPTGSLTEFPIPASAGGAGELTVGPDGNLWFIAVDVTSDQIGRITPSGSLTLFPIPESAGLHGELTDGPDGNLWFPEGHAIGRITPAGVVTEFPLSANARAPGDLTVGPGGNLWFIAFNDGSPSGFEVGEITLSGAVTDFPVPASNGLGYFSDASFELTVGPDGNIWFPEDIATDSLSGAAAIGRMTPSGDFTQFPIPGQGYFAGGLTDGPDGNLWFPVNSLVEGDTVIGRITPAGAVTEFPIPSSTNAAAGPLTAGPDGDLWFPAGGQIGRIAPSALLTLFPLPSGDGSPDPLTDGPDGNLWFPESPLEGSVSSVGSIVRADLSQLSGTGVVGLVHSRRGITSIRLHLDEALDPATAGKRRFYSVDAAVTTGSRNAVKIGRVRYNRRKDTVSLELAGPRKGPLIVTVGSGVLQAGAKSDSIAFTAVID